MGLRELHKRRFFSMMDTTPNLFLGGVGGVYSKAELAEDLNISEYFIPYFEVFGENIAARVSKTNIITKDFFGSTSGFRDNIKSYYDMDGVISVFPKGSFAVCEKLEKVYLPGCTKIGGVSGNWAFFWFDVLKTVYIPNCLEFGNTVGEDGNVFRAYQTNWAVTTLYVDPSMRTINNGGLEGDLNQVLGWGASVIDNNNNILPDPITNLSYTTTGTDTTLNFTPPSATNNLDFYEVFINGFYKEEITGSGAVISGLSNGDKVTVYACDEYYNRSISNEVVISGL
jgi:hypothetical protein